MSRDDVIRTVEWVLLLVQVPSQAPIAAGILLVDCSSDVLYVKLLSKLTGTSEDMAEFWRELPEDLEERSREVGGSELLNWLENTASHFVQTGPRTRMETANVREVMDSLYMQHVSNNIELQQPIERTIQRGAGR